MGPEEEIVYCILTVHCMYIVDKLYMYCNNFVLGKVGGWQSKMIYCGHTKCAGGQWTNTCLLLLDEGSESWPLAAFIPFSITETIVVQQSWSGAIVLRYCMDIVSRGLTAVLLQLGETGERRNPVTSYNQHCQVLSGSLTLLCFHSN